MSRKGGSMISRMSLKGSTWLPRNPRTTFSGCKWWDWGILWPSRQHSYVINLKGSSTQLWSFFLLSFHPDLTWWNYCIPEYYCKPLPPLLLFVVLALSAVLIFWSALLFSCRGNRSVAESSNKYQTLVKDCEELSATEQHLDNLLHMCTTQMKLLTEESESQQYPFCDHNFFLMETDIIRPCRPQFWTVRIS